MENFAQVPTAKGCILLVDDEELIIDPLRRILEHFGYEVVTSTHGAEALQIVRAEPNRFDLVITDQAMPGLTGLELAVEIGRVRTGLPIILCTGETTPLPPEAAATAGIWEIVHKPLAVDRLLQVVKRALRDGAPTPTPSGAGIKSGALPHGRTAGTGQASRPSIADQAQAARSTHR